MSEFGLGFSMTTWGSPDAPKRALLLHGLQGVGQVFFKVAKILVTNGGYLRFIWTRGIVSDGEHSSRLRLRASRVAYPLVSSAIRPVQCPLTPLAG